jgi:replicative superfamily II helicase
MSNLIEITDTQDLVPTSAHKYAKWPFPNLNPVQSALFPFIEKDVNGLVAASTSAGKTVTAELFGSYAIRKLKKKFIFLCPLRALANEKYQDWTNPSHHFSDLKISILTGDYKGDIEQANFDDSDVIIMTSEMLNHKLRVSAKNKKFIIETGVLCVDESHLLTVDGRGDHLESALMNFAKISPETRIILLSATMPNVNEIAKWMADSLNGKETFILVSKYRPCKLNIHSVPYDDQSTIRPPAYEMIDGVCKFITKFSADKFLVFAHTKKMGELIINALASRNIESKFHNANLNKDQRQQLEDRFKNDKSLRVLIATSTLAYGLNLPARRVVIAGVHRGTEIVPSYDILQMVGRAGRPAFDPEGDAYVLYPESQRIDLQKRTLVAQPIISRMLDISASGDYATMAFHLLYEIYSKNIKKLEDANLWFTRTLAFFQNRNIRPTILESTLKKLVKLNILSYDEETETFDVTGLGKVSVIFYADPFMVASYSINFSQLFRNETINDVDICLALANTSANFVGSISKEDKILMKDFLQQVAKTNRSVPENVQKIACLYHRILHGRHEPKYFGVMKTLQQDMPRIVAILQAIDNFSKKWNRKNFWSTLGKRMQHGVPAAYVDLIGIKGVGKAKAEKLFQQGYKTKADILKNLDSASKIAGIKADQLAINIKESQD